MNIYHVHHIVPKHIGGTDDPSNLIRLTIEEHAEAHKKLWEKHGRWEDYCAYLGLSKLISSSEASKMALLEGRRKGGKIVGSLPKDHKQQAQKITDMWKIPGMREHLVEKRKEQSRMGKNPMQGKKQNKVCCVNCKNIISVNGLILHQRKCVS